MDGDSISTLSDAMRALQAEGYTGNWYASEEGVQSPSSGPLTRTQSSKK